ncbi:MAG: autotransporter domain-containing protein, partial [Variovorax sp.]
IEPQLQLVHQRIDLDDVALSGAQVRQDTEGGWLLRAGVRVKGEIATGLGTLQPYGRFNVYSSRKGTDVARFTGPAAYTDILTRTGGTSSELAAGATLALGPTTSLYGEIGKLWASGGNTRVKSGVSGSVGVKVRW